MKRIVLFAAASLFIFSIKAQEQDVVLPSPETAALFRYQDYPMDYSTGLPQISIPLFTVTNGSLSVPISISYHASGFKVTDVDGPIAVGWSLNVGGMVSRTIHGDPDFGVYPFPDPFDPYLSTPGQNTLEILERVTHYPDNPTLVTSGEWADSQYDIFSYSLGKHSGKFLFDDNAGIKTPVMLPLKPISVIPSTDPTGLNKLRIIDDMGDHYTFVPRERRDDGQATGFALDSIVSANGQHYINYTYDTNPLTAIRQSRKYASGYQIINDLWPDSNNTPPSDPSPEEGNIEQHYDINRIVEIDFEQGTVEFVLVGGSGQDQHLIDHIQLKDRNGTVIRKINFKRSPLHTIWGVLGTTNLVTHKLTGIEIQDINGTTEEHYSFEYYPTVYTAGNAANQIIDVRHIDFWGYYNASGENNMIPKWTVDDYSFKQSSGPGTITVGNAQASLDFRGPLLDALKSGVLKRIYYPTGGNTEFLYENNKYKDSESGVTKLGPGLRVEEIINSDGQGSSIKRTFEYSSLPDQITHYGEIELEPKLEFMFTQNLYRHAPANNSDHRERTYHSGFIPSLSELSARPIRYSYVTEYRGDKTNNEGKIIYEYDNPQWTPFPLANHDGNNKWHITNYKYWNTPMLKHQTEYKAVKDINNIVQGYDERRKVSNTYTTLEPYAIEGLHVQRNYIFPQGTQTVSQNIHVEDWFFNYTSPRLTVYAYAPYSIPVGTKNLTSTTEKLTHDDGSTISTTTSYLYNSNNLVSEITTTTSRKDGNTMENLLTKKEITYPSDHTTITVLNDMNNLNMLNYRVEEKNFFNDQPTTSTKINYHDWGNTIFRPESMETAKENDPLEARTTYHSYDSKGNPQEISRQDGPHTYYIWGYRKTRPIAKIDNFEDADITTAIQDKINLAVNASDLDFDRTIDTINSNGTKNYIGEEGDLREALDDLRVLLPADSHITAYTYDPLVGATSMTDSRGYTVYYEYDDFNRLKAVKDADGNFVSDYDYSYKQPISN